jgi:hypothetical protein
MVEKFGGKERVFNKRNIRIVAVNFNVRYVCTANGIKVMAHKVCAYGCILLACSTFAFLILSTANLFSTNIHSNYTELQITFDQTCKMKKRERRAFACVNMHGIYENRSASCECVWVDEFSKA